MLLNRFNLSKEELIQQDKNVFISLWLIMLLDMHMSLFKLITSAKLQ